jgi:DNA primase
MDWALETIKESPEEEKGELLKLAAGAISSLESTNPILFNKYLSLLSAEFGVSLKWLKLNAPKVRVNPTQSHEEPVPHHEKVFLKALLEGELKLPVKVSPTIFLSSRVAKLYSILANSEIKEPVSLQAEYPEEASFISELLLMDVTEDEVLRALCRVLTKELESRMKRVKAFNEKMKIKRLIFDLKRGNLGVIEQIIN